MRSLSVLKSQQLKKLLGLPQSPLAGLLFLAKSSRNLAAPFAQPSPPSPSAPKAPVRRTALATAGATGRSMSRNAPPAICPLRRLGLAGSWVLPPGQAVTLQSADDSALQVTQGRIWATLDGPHSGPANDLGDVVLQAGERLALRAGQRVVIEAFLPGVARRAAVEGACFSLDLSGD